MLYLQPGLTMGTLEVAQSVDFSSIKLEKLTNIPNIGHSWTVSLNISNTKYSISVYFNQFWQEFFNQNYLNCEWLLKIHCHLLQQTLITWNSELEFVLNKIISIVLITKWNMPEYRASHIFLQQNCGIGRHWDFWFSSRSGVHSTKDWWDQNTNLMENWTHNRSNIHV